MGRHDIYAEGGSYAVVFAFVILTMMGFSALAVDLSGSFEDARHQQTYADLACLAGVRHLPQEPGVAFEKARENVEQNIPDGTWDDGEIGGYGVEIFAPYGDDDTVMRVEVTQDSPTTFGRLFGIEDIRVTQEATCGVFTMGGSLPFGSMPGGFGGQLQNAPPCDEDQGNCWQLEVPRSDVGGGVGNPQAKWFHLNVAWNTDRALVPWDGDTIVCTTETPECNVLEAKQGVTKGQLSDAVSLTRNIPEVGGDIPGRLHMDPGWEDEWHTYETISKRYLEDATPFDVSDAVPGFPYLFETDPGAPEPDGWDHELYGPWSNFTHVTQINADGCEHPRLGHVPILRRHPSGEASWPSGNSGEMQVAGGFWVYLENPNEPLDHDPGSDHINTVTAKQIWFGDSVHCGSADGPLMDYEPGSPKVWKLISNG